MTGARFIVLFAALVLCGCKITTHQSDLPAFRQVSANVWRGGQPTAVGMARLRALGITAIVKLNEGKEPQHDGMALYEFPISLHEQLFGVPASKVKSALNAIRLNVNASEKVYVHCENGWDRTGLVIALYRHQVEGWPKKKAEKEMLDNGFHKELHGLWEYWERAP